MGWLNIEAERRAHRALLWLSYLFYAVLVVALYGIVWGAEALPLLRNPFDPKAFSILFAHGPVLFGCLGLWLFYLGAGLLPKLRERYETEELEKFKAAHPLDEVPRRSYRPEDGTTYSTLPEPRSKGLGRKR